MNAPRILPAYEVEKLDGTRMHTIKVPRYDKNKKGDKVLAGFDSKEVEIEAGYMVYFRRGHSVRLTEEQLTEGGFDKPAALIDDDGEVHGRVQEGILKRRSKAAQEVKPDKV